MTGKCKPVLVLQHRTLGPAGLLGEWLDEGGLPVVTYRADNGGPCPDPRGFAFVACFGSRFGPHDATERSGVAGRARLEQAVETDDPELIPAGPWVQWHWHHFHTPPGASELARSAKGSQASTTGPHLGVQFHPERARSTSCAAGSRPTATT